MVDTSYQFAVGVGICLGLAAASIALGAAFGLFYVKPMKLFTVSREELWKKAVR